MVSAGIINFPKILTQTQNKEIKKYIGLRQQVNAYAEIYLYSYIDKKNISDFNMQLLEGGNISLVRCVSVNDGAYGSDSSENKFMVKENKKIKGRYEAVILTGRYVLEIDKTGYEVNYKLTIF